LIFPRSPRELAQGQEINQKSEIRIKKTLNKVSHEKTQKKDLPPSRLRSESKKKGVSNFPAEKVEYPLFFY
jgi:hypothetical protein